MILLKFTCIYIYISLHKYHIIMKFQLHHEAVHDSWVLQAHCFLAHTLWTNACLGVLAADNFSLLQVTVGERNGTKLDHFQYVPINTHVQFYITLLAYRPPTTCLPCLRVPSNSQQSYLNPHLQVRSDDLSELQIYPTPLKTRLDLHVLPTSYSTCLKIEQVIQTC